MTITALALYSGGLDSMMACKVMAAQGVCVKAVKFVTPFFGYELLARRSEYIRQVKEKYDIDLLLQDVSDKFLELLRDPPHGFGRHFNPCIDCKILLLSEARMMMAELGADFIITGEVIGQRPMSQRRDALRLIERDSGCEGLLLRPLCAKNLAPTQPELHGLVDRDRLLDISGRSRQAQISLAAQFGVTDYPAPAGGCLLTDRQIGERIRRFYEDRQRITADDILPILTGRHFRLPGGGWLAIGRDERENLKISDLARESDVVLQTVDWPGPVAILRYSVSQDDIDLAAGLVARFSKKVRGKAAPVAVVIYEAGDTTTQTGQPLADDVYDAWRR